MRDTRSQPRPGLDRRAVVAGAGALGVAAVLTAAGSRAADVESHGLSTFGDLQLPPDFRHLPYVNPNAPKGGTLSLQIKQTVGNQNFDTFNTLHIYVLKGDGAAGMPGTFDTLMAGSGDEPDALCSAPPASCRPSPSTGATSGSTPTWPPRRARSGFDRPDRPPARRSSSRHGLDTRHIGSKPILT